MVLSDRSIKEELAKGRIVIRPLDESCIQPASVDVHLDRLLRVFNPWKQPYYIDLSQPLDGLTQVVEIPEGGNFALAPGHFVLGSTVEYVEVPDTMMARLEGKSSLGRIGLLIHATAGYVDPGWKGKLTLELSNVSAIPILLYAGMKVSQISFHLLTTPADRPYGSPGLNSKYQGQTGPTPTKFYREFPTGPLMNLASMPVVRKSASSISTNNRLREWLKQSRFQGSVRALAKALGIPHKTVEDWVYRGAQPNRANRAKLFGITELAEFKVAEAAGHQTTLPEAGS